MNYSPALSSRAAGLIHSSTRTVLSTNASADPARPPRRVARVTQLQLTWHDGALLVQFSAHEAEVPGLPARRARGAR